MNGWPSPPSPRPACSCVPSGSANRTETSGWTRVKVVRLTGLAALIAAAALIRPGDAVFLVIVLLAAALAVRSWRRWPVIAAIVIGMAAGSAEWIAEAYARFGGPLARLHLASAEQGGFGLRLGVWAELRGGQRTDLVPAVHDRLALPGPQRVVAGPPGPGRARNPGRPPTWGAPCCRYSCSKAPPTQVVALARRARSGGERSSALLAGVCALALASQYLFGIWYAAPRFLLPAYALAAIPVADLIGWIIARTRPAERPAMRVLIGFVLLLQVVTQHAVLMRQVHDTVALHTDYGDGRRRPAPARHQNPVPDQRRPGDPGRLLRRLRLGTRPVELRASQSWTVRPARMAELETARLRQELDPAPPGLAPAS